MQDSNWYYTDRTGRRRGPVTSAGVVAAFRSGELLAIGLIWRQGMREWLPFARCELEIGVSPDDHAAAPPTEPYAPPRALGSPNMAQNVDRSDIVYAGFWRRCAAAILDGLILFLPGFLFAAVLGIPFAALTRSFEPASRAMLQALFGFVVGLVVRAAYFATMESSERQATWGKRAFGIKVIDGSGERLSFGRALGRWSASALSFLTLYIGFAMAGFTERKRALHDMVADTLVVDRWAYTANPERQQRRAPGLLIAAVILLFAVPFTAILAAIAIPAYQDYVIRTQISEGAIIADGPKQAVANYYFQHWVYPADNAQAQLPEPDAIAGSYERRIEVRNGVIYVTYGNHANAAIAGQQLAFAPHANGNGIAWTCNTQAGTTIDNKFRPAACRP